jgi:hypothetical protein
VAQHERQAEVGNESPLFLVSISKRVDPILGGNGKKQAAFLELENDGGTTRFVVE